MIETHDRSSARVAEPVVAAEVHSPSDTTGRIEPERMAYGTAGLASYLEVDLDRNELVPYALVDGSLLVVENGTRITLTLPGVAPFSVDTEQLRP
jgi:hypothetical protein